MTTSSFEKLHPALQYHIANTMGWANLREVQNRSIEAFLAGANFIVLAPTAGGKTESAFFPVISEILSKRQDGLSVIYVSPIKALLNNQEERLRRYFEMVGLSVGCWHGDTSPNERKRMVRTPPNCLLTTPESLEVMLISSTIDHNLFLSNLRVVVIDEVHAFASGDRGWHLLSLFERLSKISGYDLQRIGLSATVGNKDELVEWLGASSPRPRMVVEQKSDGSALTPDVQIDYVGSLLNAAKVIAALHKGEKRLVFCDSRSRVEELASFLRSLEVSTFVSHSSLSLDERKQSEQAFASSRNCVIVATSALELGIDVGDLDRVIQIDAPTSVSSFLQRMGRTGRRPETTRNCLFLATSDEGLLKACAIVELWKNGYVEPVLPPSKPLHIFVQQIMALAIQQKGLPRNNWKSWISGVPAFRELDDGAVEFLLDHLIKTEILWDEHGVLWLGTKGQEKYGIKNFMELFSVFIAAPLFTVFHGNSEIGSVDETTFYTKESAEPKVLLLGGKNWKVKYVDWKRRQAFVVPAEELGKSRWKGQGQFLSFEICHSIRKCLREREGLGFLSQRAKAQMELIADEFPWMDSDTEVVCVREESQVDVWTFAGGAFNAALAEHIGGKSENFSISIKSASIDDVRSKLATALNTSAVKTMFQVSDEALSELKFADVLPKDLAVGILQNRFDVSRVSEKLKKYQVRSVIAARG
jgi:ATP-dependent Lhr-like helicase